MEALLSALESWSFAQFLRHSRWGYAAVNATHIFGIALLIGSVVPLNLRLLGCWRTVAHPVLARILVPVAGSGLAIAVVAGLLLFSVRAVEYAAIGVLQVKLGLVTIGTLSAILLHVRSGFALEKAGKSQLTLHAIVSLICWPGALICGRLIAFIDS